MTRADDQAARLLAHAEITHAPVDVEKIARLKGARVVHQEMEGNDISGMLVREDNRVIIGVNSHHATVRQRFTIAHEIGHLVLHRGRALILDTPVRVNFRDRRSSLAEDREEMEANRFAAALLMPAEFVLAEVQARQVKQVDELIDELAGRFNVSTEAMGYRLVNLGILS
ncbi:ImmA/IrrE family metallo-endopeptidase [Promicromonospora panici]|uniref:ImmA/IrrE family metallo-endopeptidase n=1 Tax=Promicromonospora panici TaxID=2219658 RepID=UPI00101DC4B2|nr:ImmA/IrrE family metallo-endopeptidase [Promicromonospora panici]